MVNPNPMSSVSARAGRAADPSRRRLAGLGCLVALALVATSAWARDPGPWQQPGNWGGFRPPAQSNARGMPPAPPPAPINTQARAYGAAQWPQGQSQPAYGQPPGYQSGYQNPWQYGYPGSYGQQPATQTVAKPPRVELAITNDQPYVQENVLLRLRLISDKNLERADPELPTTNDFMLQKIDGPTTGSRTGEGGKQEIVNDFTLTLTPLRAGDLDLPPIKVTGTQGGSGGYGAQSSRYEVKTAASRIQVRPIMSSVSPWLPLHELTLTPNLDSTRDVEEGQPVTISLELKAVGATGAQLPSLEGMLDAPDYRVYREQTLTEGGLSADRRNLVGKRTEYYTLVPHSGGRLKVPEIQVVWWNVDKGTREVAGTPLRTLQVDGESGPFGLSRLADEGQGWGFFWIPLTGLLLLLLGYWGGVWYQARTTAGKQPLGAQARVSVATAVRSGTGAALGWLSTGLGRLLRRLNPARAVQSVGRTLTRKLPEPTRLWLCVGAADREAEPAAWCQQFQAQACRNLAFDPKEPLAGLADKLAQVRPNADRTQIERLMQELDGALYGRKELDFPRWKRDLKRSLRPRRGAARGLLASLTPRRVYLPELNPR